MSTTSPVLPRWTIGAPIAAWVVLGAAVALPGYGVMLALVGVALAASVFAAVHHAEVVAHRVGEPFGTLVLAVAVTVIEVALIVSVMLTSGPEKAGLARDTVFAAVMIAATLAVLASLSVLTLVMPNFTTTREGPLLSSSQLAFAGISSLVLYGVFVFVQTVRHRDYFLAATPDESVHAEPPSVTQAGIAAALLLVCLVAVVLLAKLLSPTVETAVQNIGAPPAVVGIVIAALVLLPEGLAAVRAARADRLQNSLNLALGSALASIGLTIPAVAGVFLWTGQPLVLGINGKEMIMLALTLLVGTLTLSTGRTTILQGAVHLSLFAAYLFLSFAP
jgi:Ca2+:H+ antiporter